MIDRRNFLRGAAKAVGAVAAMATGLLALSRENLYGGPAGGGMNGLSHLEGEPVTVLVELRTWSGMRWVEQRPLEDYDVSDGVVTFKVPRQAVRVFFRPGHESTFYGSPLGLRVEGGKSEGPLELVRSPNILAVDTRNMTAKRQT